LTDTLILHTDALDMSIHSTHRMYYSKSCKNDERMISNVFSRSCCIVNNMSHVYQLCGRGLSSMPDSQFCHTPRHSTSNSASMTLVRITFITRRHTAYELGTQQALDRQQFDTRHHQLS